MDSSKARKIRIVRVLTAVFLVLLLASLANLYYTHQQPILEKKIVTVASYVHRAVYDYVAELKPNIIYNKTTLRPNEGVLYATLTNRINVSFTYVFSSNPQPESVSIVMRRLTAKIESPDKWMKVLQEGELLELLNLNLNGSANFTLEVNCALLRQIVNTIDRELGVYSLSYNVYVIPEIFVNARIAGRSIGEVYVPQLTITFKTGADKAGYISLEGLEQTQSRDIRDVIEIAHPEVESQRNLSYVATTLTAIGLTTSIIIHHRASENVRKRPASVKVDKILKEHKDIIVEAKTSSPEAQVVVEVKSLQELVKTAEILAKPILKAVDGEGQIFYVMDGSIKYQYKMQESKTSEM